MKKIKRQTNIYSTCDTILHSLKAKMKKSGITRKRYIQEGLWLCKNVLASLSIIFPSLSIVKRKKIYFLHRNHTEMCLFYFTAILKAHSSSDMALELKAIENMRMKLHPKGLVFQRQCPFLKNKIYDDVSLRWKTTCQTQWLVPYISLFYE